MALARVVVIGAAQAALLSGTKLCERLGEDPQAYGIIVAACDHQGAGAVEGTAVDAPFVPAEAHYHLGAHWRLQVPEDERVVR